MVWYCHLFKNFPQFVVIYTVKGFDIVSKAEVGISLEFSCFSYDIIGKIPVSMCVHMHMCMCVWAHIKHHHASH